MATKGVAEPGLFGGAVPSRHSPRTISADLSQFVMEAKGFRSLAPLLEMVVRNAPDASIWDVAGSRASRGTSAQQAPGPLGGSGVNLARSVRNKALLILSTPRFPTQLLGGPSSARRKSASTGYRCTRGHLHLPSSYFPPKENPAQRCDTNKDLS